MRQSMKSNMLMYCVVRELHYLRFAYKHGLKAIAHGSSTP